MSGDLGDLGRFAEPSLLILISLGAGPKHGYAIMSDVEGMSGTRLGPGTLYAALARLESRGLVESLPPSDRRRPYRITAAGGRALTAQLEALERLVDTARSRLAHDAVGAAGRGR